MTKLCSTLCILNFKVFFFVWFGLVFFLSCILSDLPLCRWQVRLDVVLYVVIFLQNKALLSSTQLVIEFWQRPPAEGGGTRALRCPWTSHYIHLGGILFCDSVLPSERQMELSSRFSQKASSDGLG